MVQHLRSLEQVYLKSSWVTIGSFDGVHRGHQEILSGLTVGAHAVGAPAVLLTFHPHPKVVLRDLKDPFYLTTPEERAALAAELGIDLVITYPFDRQTAAMSAHNFMALLKKHLALEQLWVGYDFALGHQREGDVNMLRVLGETLNYRVHVTPPVKVDGQVVSSSHIRRLLLEGQVEQASKMLGRPYRLDGPVIRGDGRGRMIGIPTANLAIPVEKICPAVGVYACRAVVEGKVFAAATNIGVRPTFDGKDRTTHVEAHLLDVDEDLYGREIQLHFIARLRGEIRFPSIEALVSQIRQDIQQTRALFSKDG